MLNGASSETIRETFAARLTKTLLIRRPSNSREVYVRNANVLHMAAAEWYPDILDYLASFHNGIDNGCTVEDSTNEVSLYHDVTPLFICAMSGKIQMVNSLLSNGAVSDKMSSAGETALYEACYEGHLSVVERLIASGSNPNITNTKGTTCLMIASYADNINVLRYLIESGADLRKTDDVGRNCLFYCVSGGALMCLVFLLEMGDVPIISDKNNANLLMDAAFHCNNNIFSYLADRRIKLGLDVNQKDNSGKNALFYACEGGHITMMEALMRHGVRLAPTPEGMTLLMHACLRANYHATQYLVQHAVKLRLDIHAIDNNGRNCLFYSISGGNVKIVELLLGHGLKFEATTGDGITLLMQAAAKSQVKVMEFLLKCKWNTGTERKINWMNKKDQDGWNALFYCIVGGTLKQCKFLFDNGVLAEPSLDGRTIFMQACARGDIDFVRYLADREDLGYSIHDKDKEGWNAAFFCVQGDHMEILKFLIKRSIKLEPSIRGRTILMEALDRQCIKIPLYLTDNAISLGIEFNQCDNTGANVLFSCVANGNLNLLKTLQKFGACIKSDNSDRTILMTAAYNGQVDIVGYLLRSNDVHVNLQDHIGRNSAFHAIEGGHLEPLQILLANGATLSDDKRRTSPLMISAQGSNDNILKYLLHRKKELNLDPNAKDVDGNTSLNYAKRAKNNVNHIRLLLQCGAKVACNSSGKSVLSEALEEKNTDLIVAILDHLSLNGNEIAVRNFKQCNIHDLLLHAVRMGNTSILKKVSNLYDPKADHDSDGTTLLMEATSLEEPTHILIFLLKDFSVNLHAIDIKGKNALTHAVCRKNTKAVQILLEYGAKPVLDKTGLNPLMISIGLDNALITNCILNLADHLTVLLRQHDDNTRNVVHYCAMKGDCQLMYKLIHHNCDINSMDVDQVTPLMVACEHGHLTCVNTLLRFGACVSAVDKYGRSSLHYACSSPDAPLMIIWKLVFYGSPVSLGDNQSDTPLHLLCQNDHVLAIKCLLDCGANPVTSNKKGQEPAHFCTSVKSKRLLAKYSVIAETQVHSIMCNQIDITHSIHENITEFLEIPVLSQAHLSMIGNESQHDKKVHKLLTILLYRGPKAFKQFGQAIARVDLGLSYKLERDSYVPIKEYLV